MARNTGRGSRYATKSPDSKRFQKAKAEGGNFRVGVPRRNFWKWVRSIWTSRR